MHLKLRRLSIGESVMTRADDQVKLTAPVIDQATGETLLHVFGVGNSYAEAKQMFEDGTKVVIETGVYR